MAVHRWDVAERFAAARLVADEPAARIADNTVSDAVDRLVEPLGELALRAVAHGDLTISQAGLADGATTAAVPVPKISSRAPSAAAASISAAVMVRSSARMPQHPSSSMSSSSPPSSRSACSRAKSGKARTRAGRRSRAG
ncbi:hypothetical protein [Sorangium sp. So ce1182]|uniref:hypothetical protein n=1 Tax=Sorangium sp. So ce1182 TaxID=3133334 RepID=UPI003F60A38E